MKEWKEESEEFSDIDGMRMEREGECREMRLENTTVRKECVLHTQRERGMCVSSRERGMVRVRVGARIM